MRSFENFPKNSNSPNGEEFSFQKNVSSFDSLKDVPFMGDKLKEKEELDLSQIPQEYIYDRKRRPIWVEAMKQEGSGKVAKTCRPFLDKIMGDKILTWDILSQYDKNYRKGNKFLVDTLSEMFGIEPPKIKYHRIKGRSIAGAYDPRDNSIHFFYRMNREERGRTDDMNTIAHEMWHAYQEAILRQKKGVRSDLYRINSDLYISSEDDLEGYLKQIFEMEAFFFGDHLENSFRGARRHGQDVVTSFIRLRNKIAGENS
ncbi:hypothetical protein IJG71_02230 [Candidatus Saccharibacteria bacterium]|nr:hypothetical protein [Candidatus Saccharibacteria bacterium]